MGRGDLPYDRPADDTRNLTTPAAILSNNDRLTVGTSSGQFFGSSGELGDGEAPDVLPLIEAFFAFKAGAVLERAFVQPAPDLVM